MRRVLLTAVCVGMLAGMPARAETWPDYGYYHVEDSWFEGVRFCRLRVELVVDDAVFAFILRENPDGSLLVQFLTQDARVPNAEIVRVGIDRKRKAEEVEMQRLKRENKRLEEENLILRKAAAVFAKGVA